MDDVTTPGEIEFVFNERKPNGILDHRVQIFDLRFKDSGVRVASINVMPDGWWTKKLCYEVRTVFHNNDGTTIGRMCNTLDEAHEYLGQLLKEIFRGKKVQNEQH